MPSHLHTTPPNARTLIHYFVEQEGSHDHEGIIIVVVSSAKSTAAPLAPPRILLQPPHPRLLAAWRRPSGLPGSSKTERQQSDDGQERAVRGQGPGQAGGGHQRGGRRGQGAYVLSILGGHTSCFCVCVCVCVCVACLYPPYPALAWRRERVEEGGAGGRLGLLRAEENDGPSSSSAFPPSQLPQPLYPKASRPPLPFSILQSN
jgi:hypothetical protein